VVSVSISASITIFELVLVVKLKTGVLSKKN
jgi:hypothetical protein